jgi:AcrR family transcriptional regulator
VSIEERRQRERALRRTAILAAAARAFARAGIDGASMGAIAREAELGKATLYYYFPTKEALHEAVLDEGTEAFFASLPQAPPQGEDLAGAVWALLRGYLAFFEREPDLHRVLAGRLVHAMGASWSPGAPRHVREDMPQPPAHLAFMRRLLALLHGTPWAREPAAFHAFLADVLIALSQRVLAGQGELDAAIAFYLGVVRHPPSSAETSP